MLFVKAEKKLVSMHKHDVIVVSTVGARDDACSDATESGGRLATAPQRHTACTPY